MTEELAVGKVEKRELKNIVFDNGILPKDYDDVMRFAGLVHGAGLAPKGFDTPAKVAVGILTNLEQGRPAVTGLQDLAIINGRCGTYGNAITAKITASGLMDKDYPKETETGTPYEDDWKFTYMVKRKGRPEVTGVWTWIDSKRAGFDNPTTKDGRKDIWSPWSRFTRRMMQWKARSFVNQDEFGDILRGMTPVEELYDIVDLERGQNGTYGSPETPKEPKVKPDYTAQELKDKLEAGDEQVEGYRHTAEQADKLIDKIRNAQERLEEKREQDGQPTEPSLFDRLNNARSQFRGMATNKAEEVKKMTAEEQSTLSDKWRRLCPDDPIPWAPVTKTEEPPIPPDIENNDATARLKFIGQMRNYLEKDKTKYRAVMVKLGFESLNDVKPKDEDVVLGFMAEEFEG